MSTKANNGKHERRIIIEDTQFWFVTLQNALDLLAKVCFICLFLSLIFFFFFFFFFYVLVLFGLFRGSDFFPVRMSIVA